MKRRSLLKAAGLGMGAGTLMTFARTRRAEAAWGDIPAGVASGWTPALKVLEIHLWGGMAPWESFYFRPGAGGQTRGFNAEVTGLTWNGICAGSPAGLATQMLSNDSQAKPVHLGPFAKPLWRTDILNKTRVIVMRHDLPPHEAAIPYALAGRKIGRPGFCGLGAPLQRRGRTLASGGHPLPFSYCLIPGAAVGQPYFQALDAVGNHDGSAKPVVLTVSAGGGEFVTNLNRGFSPAADALISQYRAQYAAWLKPPPAPVRVRSSAFSDYESSVSSLFSAPQLATLLSGAPSLAPPVSDFCAREVAPPFPTGQGISTTALKAAAYLLTRTGDQSANYACVIDGGKGPPGGSGGFGYDVHNVLQASRTGSNLFETLSALASIIRDPANPTADDVNKLDLATTLIVIKTDFGRTPFRSNGGVPSPTSNGRDHWPEAFANVIIGGPVAGPKVIGSIADGGGSGDQGKAEMGFFFTPTDVQATVLLAAGINPFDVGNFQLGELTASLQGANHDATMTNLRTTFLS